MTNPFSDFRAQADRAKLAAEEHRASCKLAACDWCERYVCGKCSVGVTRPHSLCEPCEAKRDEQRREQAQRDWNNRVESVIPETYSGAVLDAPWLVALVGSKVIADARASTSEPRVAALGPPGSGKTTLLAAMLRASRARDGKPTILWVSAHQLAKARGLHPLGEGEAPLIDQALRARVLVVDELGGEDQRYASAVSEVLYERHADCRPTWVTTGVAPKEIADRYGGGIARRIFEDAKVFRLVGRR